MTFRERPDVWQKDEELRQLMRRIDLVVEQEGDQEIKFPPILRSSSVVLPSNFREGEEKEKLWLIEEKNGCEDAEDSYQDPDQDVPKQQEETKDCHQEHPISMQVPHESL